jgi:hypothetical protein
LTRRNSLEPRPELDTTDTSDPSANAELLRSLGRLVRGLSALFWGLPFALIICVQTAKTELLKSFNIVPPIVVTGWLCVGLWLLGSFQKQERVWHRTLDRAKLLAMVNLGLSPFLYWWSQVPNEPFFIGVVGVMGATGLLFLGTLNMVLYRLSAMLPDEHLREETRHFTTLNRYLVFAILLLGLAFVAYLRFPGLISISGDWFPISLSNLGMNALWLMVFLVLLPLAMTMALIWKIKEVILDSVFGAGR